MSVFEEYQLTEMGELFNVEVLEQSINSLDTLTPQERAVLQFIVDNPDEHFIELQKTFSMPDKLVISLVLDYGTPSDEYDEMKELEKQVRNS